MKNEDDGVQSKDFPFGSISPLPKSMDLNNLLLIIQTLQSQLDRLENQIRSSQESSGRYADSISDSLISNDSFNTLSNEETNEDESLIAQFHELLGTSFRNISKEDVILKLNEIHYSINDENDYFIRDHTNDNEEEEEGMDGDDDGYVEYRDDDKYNEYTVEGEDNGEEDNDDDNDDEDEDDGHINSIFNIKMNQIADMYQFPSLLMDSFDMHSLNELVIKMYEKNELEQCIHTYWIRRRNRLKENLKSIEMKNYEKYFLENLEWKDLEKLMYDWIQNMHILVIILMPAEKRLFEKLFFGVRGLNYKYFSQIMYEEIVESLGSVKAMASVNRMPEAAAVVLNVFECVHKLTPQMDFLIEIGGLSCSKEIFHFLNDITSFIRQIFYDFSKLIRNHGLNSNLNSNSNLSLNSIAKDASSKSPSIPPSSPSSVSSSPPSPSSSTSSPSFSSSSSSLHKQPSIPKFFFLRGVGSHISNKLFSSKNDTNHDVNEYFFPKSDHEPIASYVMNYIEFLKENGYLDILKAMLSEAYPTQTKSKQKSLKSKSKSKSRSKSNRKSDKSQSQFLKQQINDTYAQIQSQSQSQNPVSDLDRRWEMEKLSQMMKSQAQLYPSNQQSLPFPSSEMDKVRQVLRARPQIVAQSLPSEYPSNYPTNQPQAYPLPVLPESPKQVSVSRRQSFSSLSQPSESAQKQVWPQDKNISQQIQVPQVQVKQVKVKQVQVKQISKEGTDLGQSQLKSNQKVQLSICQSASWILQLLQSLLRNLEEKSRLIQHDHVRFIFLINNVQYIVQKIKNSELKELFLDEYIWCLEEYVSNQCDEFVSCILKKFGVFFEKGKDNPDSVKKKFKAFDHGMDFLYENKEKFFIKDENLRIRIAHHLENAIVSHYSNFIQFQMKMKILAERRIDKIGIWSTCEICQIIENCFLKKM